MSERESARRSNRERMPNVARMVDDFRAVFGDVKVVYAHDKETGVEVGKPSDLSSTFSVYPLQRDGAPKAKR